MIIAWLAAAWLAGIATAAMYGRGAWPLALGLAAAMLAVAAIRRDRSVAVLALVLPAVFVLGVVRFETAHRTLRDDAVSRFNDGVAMRIRAVLRDDPDVRDTSQRFAVTVRAVGQGGEWRQTSGGVLVTGGLLPRYKSGDVLELEGQIATPPYVAGFDYGDYLARKGIDSVMEFPRASHVGHENDSIVRATILHVRRRLADALALSLPEPQSSLAQSVLLGQRSALPLDVAADLNTTNTSHLVVVSGSNIVFVSAFGTLLFSWLLGRRRALLASIALVVAYAVLVGLSPPVARGVIMGVLLIIARLAGRPSSGWVAILLAAAVMVGIDPIVVRDVSFQLTFAATAGIVVLSAPIRAWSIELAARLFRRDEIPGAFDTLLAEPLSMTVAATVATAPLLALNFGNISLVALPANMLVVPLFPLILGSSLIAALGGLLPHARLLFAWPAYYLLTYWIELARHLASLPHAATDIGSFTAEWAWVTYAIIATAAFALSKRFGAPLGGRVTSGFAADLGKLRPFAVAGVPAAVLVATAGFALWPSSPRRLRVDVLDVGQGDAILVRAPNGTDVLVDGGPGPAVLRGLGEELPWRDRSIELLILTHPQADHVTGLLDVLRRYDVRRVLAGPGVQPSLAYRAWLDAVRSEGREIEIAHQGMSFDLGDGARLDVVGPDDKEAADSNINNTGAVVRVSYGDVSVLLTADIEAGAEAALLADGVDLRTTVLKVPHHGSKTSSTTAFLEAVQPSVAVISSGINNRFGHPAPAVVERLQEYAAVYNTADSGAVHLSTDGHRLWLSTGR